MKELLRSSAVLLRDHPVLWVPYLAIQLLQYLLNIGSPYAEHKVLYWCLHTHSALGGESLWADPNSFTVRWRFLFLFPFEPGQHYLDLCLMAACMVGTTVWARSILEGKSARLTEMLSRLRNDAGRILWFAFKVSMTALLLVGVPGVLLTSLESAIRWPDWVLVKAAIFHDLIHSEIGLYAIGCGFFLLLAWCISPWAMNLLRETKLDKTQAALKRTGRWFAMAVAILETLCSFGVQRFEHTHIYSSVADHYLIGAVGTIVTDLPLLFLYVLFALLAGPAVINPSELSLPVNDSELG
jgi:hypothetical protein